MREHLAMGAQKSVKNHENATVHEFVIMPLWADQELPSQSWIILYDLYKKSGKRDIFLPFFCGRKFVLFVNYDKKEL